MRGVVSYRATSVLLSFVFPTTAWNQVRLSDLQVKPTLLKVSLVSQSRAPAASP